MTWIHSFSSDKTLRNCAAKFLGYSFYYLQIRGCSDMFISYIKKML